MEWKLICIPHEKLGERKLSSIRDLEATGETPVSAQVPGNFELDLMKGGYLPDLYYSTNTLLAQKLEDLHLFYFSEFEVNEAGQYLRFEGIDTYADIYVNGKLVKQTDNMFLPYEVDEGICPGLNEVLVHIRPVMLEARKYVSPVACNALKYNFASLHVRKAAHMFGWDIMPRIVSGGLWKEVRLCKRKPDRIKEVYVVTNTVDLEQKKASMRLYVTTDQAGNFSSEYRIRIEGCCDDSRFLAEQQMWHNTHAFPFEIENCKFWWPKNSGEPNLYDTTVTLFRGEEIVDCYTLEVGVRTVALERSESTDDEGNGSFVFRVNGKKIFALGTNWVPLDAFHSQDEKRLEKALELLDDIGCNMVRCWGGNAYESDEFFEFCDRHGILVWQDFAMGCAVYPEDEDFVNRLNEEAVYQIKRLRNHASLLLWAGDNECDKAYESWNGFIRNPNQNLLTRQVLKHAVEMHDYARPYLPSSPYVSEEVFQGKGILPEEHLWGPRDYFKGSYYKDTFAHFASETGYHGFNSPKSLKRFLREPEKLFEENGNPTDEYLVHSTSMEASMEGTYAYRIKLAYDQVVTLFGEACENLDDFVRQSQISQAEAKKYFIEKFRIGKWKRTGIIWWNLVDGWPQVSDAIVDYYFVKKLAYHYIKRSQQPICLMFDEPIDGKIQLMGVNDLMKEARVIYRVSRVCGVEGTAIEILSGEVFLYKDAVQVVDTVLVSPNEQEFYLIEWEIDKIAYKNHYCTNLLKYDYRKYFAAMIACGMDEFEGF